MVTEGECSCTDTTEPSNVTSLHSDVASAENLNPNTDKIIDKEVDNIEEPRENLNCVCPTTTTATASYCVGAETEAVPAVLVTKSDCKSRMKQASFMQFPPTYQCLCHKISGYVLPVKVKEGKQHSKFWHRFSKKQAAKNCYFEKDKMYEIKLQQVQCPRAKPHPNTPRKHLLKTQSVCEPIDRKVDISEGIPNKDVKDPCKSKPPKLVKKCEREENAEKIEIYYFDHGNSAYYRTTDCHPVLTTDRYVEKTDQAATRFWAEIFGSIHIGTAFVTAFILQLLRFILYSVIRPLTIGILQLLADYAVKPALSIAFNAIIQPLLILFYNIFTSLRDLCEPIAEGMGLFLREIANLCAAIRLVEVKHVHHSTPACT